MVIKTGHGSRFTSVKCEDTWISLECLVINEYKNWKMRKPPKTIWEILGNAFWNCTPKSSSFLEVIEVFPLKGGELNHLWVGHNTDRIYNIIGNSLKARIHWISSNMFSLNQEDIEDMTNKVDMRDENVLNGILVRHDSESIILLF